MFGTWGQMFCFSISDSCWRPRRFSWIWFVSSSSEKQIAFRTKRPNIAIPINGTEFASGLTFPIWPLFLSQRPSATGPNLNNRITIRKAAQFISLSAKGKVQNKHDVVQFTLDWSCFFTILLLAGLRIYGQALSGIHGCLHSKDMIMRAEKHAPSRGVWVGLTPLSSFPRRWNSMLWPPHYVKHKNLS